jgi:hypothetical protein
MHLCKYLHSVRWEVEVGLDCARYNVLFISVRSREKFTKRAEKSHWLAFSFIMILSFSSVHAIMIRYSKIELQYFYNTIPLFLLFISVFLQHFSADWAKTGWLVIRGTIYLASQTNFTRFLKDTRFNYSCLSVGLTLS